MSHRTLWHHVWFALTVALASASCTSSDAPPARRDGGPDVSATLVADATVDRPPGVDLAGVDLANASPEDSSESAEAGDSG